jgi:hypothetical protein
MSSEMASTPKSLIPQANSFRLERPARMNGLGACPSMGKFVRVPTGT